MYQKILSWFDKNIGVDIIKHFPAQAISHVSSYLSLEMTCVIDAIHPLIVSLVPL